MWQKARLIDPKAKGIIVTVYRESPTERVSALGKPEWEIDTKNGSENLLETGMAALRAELWVLTTGDAPTLRDRGHLRSNVYLQDQTGRRRVFVTLSQVELLDEFIRIPPPILIQVGT